MLHEEFINLTGIEVSHRYYSESIEPKYTEQEIDKQTFCTQWIREHKADICKALEPDIDGLIRDAALTDALRNEAHENWNRAHIAEGEAYYAKQELERIGKVEKNLRELNDNLLEQNKFMDKCLTSRTAEINKLLEEFTEYRETATKMLNDKDAEILKLKAMLFDMMYKTA